MFPCRLAASPALRATCSFGFFLASLAAVAAAQQGQTRLATLAWNGAPIPDNTGGRTLSADGRQLLFVTAAGNVVPGDTNGGEDLFLRDLVTGSVERVSLTAAGTQANGLSDGTMTPDARYVLIASGAANYVAGDTNGLVDIFVRDRQTGQVERASLANSGAQADADCTRASISDDGRFVCFESFATNLIAPPPVPAGKHIYLRDRQLGTTILVDRSTAGAPANLTSHFAQISGDGSVVVFASLASNLLTTPMPMFHDQIYARNLAAGTTELACASTSGAAPASDTQFGTPSRDGRLVCFLNSSAGFDPAWPLAGPKLFLRDRIAGTTQRVDLDSFGNAPAGDGAYSGSIDRTGRYVLFSSASNAYVTRDFNSIHDAFVRDLATGITNRVDVDSTGQEAGDAGFGCLPLGISDDGRVVAFWSIEDRLGTGDSNGFNDTYVHERWQNAPTSYCRAKLDSLGCVPEMDSSGTPSATSAAPFLVGAHALVNQQLAILHYGFAPDRRPFGGGYSCIAPPFVALAAVSTGGSPGGLDCSGAPSLDFNARIQSGLDPRLVPGAVVEAQYFFHDPGDAQGLGLTNALQFVITP